MSHLALARGRTGTFKGPREANVLSSMLGDRDVVSFKHGDDGAKASTLVVAHEVGVRVRVEGQSAPRGGQSAEVPGTAGEHFVLDATEGGCHSTVCVPFEGHSHKVLLLGLCQMWIAPSNGSIGGACALF